MCGIVGYIGGRDCADVLMDGLEKLEYRGYDSAGIAVFENGGIKTVKTRGKLACMARKLESEGKPRGFCGIGHTRWATHGEPSDVNSHPHSNGRVTIVHNGIIENYAELREFLAEKGYTFTSQTDSEIVACLLDFYYDGDPLRAISETVRELRGSYALGIMYKDCPSRIFATRKGSPLIVGIGQNEYFIASDIPAFLRYTKDYALLEDGEIVCMESGGVSFFDAHGLPVEKDIRTADWDVEQAQKLGFPHFMLKEIHEQPEVLAKTLDSIIRDGVPDFSGAGLTDELLRSVKRVFVVACGTAMHAGMIGRYAVEKLARVPVTVEIASEFRYMDPIVGENDLVILVSQSGETADTIAGMELAKARGARTLAIVNVKYSAIARGADMCVHTLAGPEIAVASTKAYTVQTAVLYALAFRFAYARGTLDEGGLRRLTSQLCKTPNAVREVIERKEDECKFIASQLVNVDTLFFIGRGFDYALSLEGSLKLKEITYIHSEAYAAGELKHGTISLIERGVPVITVATQRGVIAKTVSNMEEVKARGATIIALYRKGAEFAPGTVDIGLELDDIGLDDMLTPLPTVCALQLIAYYTSVLRGIDPDKPRNLAKSVTTE